LKNQKNLKD